MSKAALLEKLTDKQYRDAFISEEIDVGLPMQLRAMRELRGWRQSYVADKMGTKQPRFSLMEKPGYGNFSLNTLKRLASLFEVGLIVSFVPFGEMIDFVESLGRNRLEIPSFGDEYPRLLRRYSKRLLHTTASDVQACFDFSARTNEGVVFAETATQTTVATAVEKTDIATDVAPCEIAANVAAWALQSTQGDTSYAWK